MITNVNGLSIRFEVKGNGITVVLLHGWGGSWESWYPIFFQLSTKYKLIALDLPGFGKSEAPKSSWTLSDYASFVVDFLKVIKVDDLILVGHSFGGAVAIKTTLIAPKVRKLILVDSSGIRSEKPLSLLLWYKVLEAGREIYAKAPKLPFQSRTRGLIRDILSSDDFKNAGKLKDTFLKVVKEDLKTEIKKLTLPTLLIWGENDRDTPMSHAKIIHREIEHSTLKILAGCDHFSYLQKPEEFCEIVQEFIDEKA